MAERSIRLPKHFCRSQARAVFLIPECVYRILTESVPEEKGRSRIACKCVVEVEDDGKLLVPLVAATPVAAAVSVSPGQAPAKMVFTPDEVKSLNAFQRSGVRHPFTCVNGRDANHLDGEGVLLATERGWVCLYCDYTQESNSVP